MMDKKLPRRDLLKGALAGLAAIPVVAVAAQPAAQAKPAAAGGAAAAGAGAKPAGKLAMLDPNDAQAKALGYVTDTTKVDAKANPMHKPEQHCGSCVQFQGKPTDPQAPCAIFAGKGVVNPGWCKVWAKKPGV